MTEDMDVSKPTLTRPGTIERLEVYCRRRELGLPVEIPGDRALEDIAPKESSASYQMLVGSEDEIEPLIDFAANPHRQG